MHNRSDWSRLDVVGIGWTGLGGRTFGQEEPRPEQVFLFGLLAFSALAVCQDLYFRPHYFIMILPAVSLLVGVAMSKLSDLLTGRMTVVRFIPLFLLGAALACQF